jgi:hypothetical protein
MLFLLLKGLLLFTLSEVGLRRMLRELIGAISVLSSMQASRERLAVAVNNGEPEAVLDMLKRLAGLT